MSARRNSENLTLMAVGALLGIKIFRRNAKHVVTLDAHPMEHCLPRRRSLVLRGVSLCLGWLCSHE